MRLVLGLFHPLLFINCCSDKEKFFLNINVIAIIADKIIIRIDLFIHKGIKINWFLLNRFQDSLIPPKIEKGIRIIIPVIINLSPSIIRKQDSLLINLNVTKYLSRQEYAIVRKVPAITITNMNLDKFDIIIISKIRSFE